MKKHNFSMGRLRRKTLTIYKNKVLLWMADMESVILVDLKTGKRCTIRESGYKLLAEQMFRWSIVSVVCCRSADGTEYFKSEQITAEHPYKQLSVQNKHTESNRRLLDSANAQDITNMGYLASPHGIDFDDETIDRLFTKWNAWEYHTPREAAAARKQGKEIEEVRV